MELKESFGYAGPLVLLFIPFLLPSLYIGLYPDLNYTQFLLVLLQSLGLMTFAGFATIRLVDTVLLNSSRQE